MNAIPSFPFELSIEFLNKLKSCRIRCKIYLVNKVKFFSFGNLKKTILNAKKIRLNINLHLHTLRNF